MSDASLDHSDLPRHVAIIPDGNGRWAQQRSLSRIEGHIRGTANVKDIVTYARELGISVLTIYAFSSENWSRPSSEVNALMKLLTTYLSQERQHILENNIQLRAMGDISRLPAEVREALHQTVAASSQNQEMVLNFAISYGSRQEILKAVQRIAALCQAGKLVPEKIQEVLFSEFLDTANLPDPDLLIRTSGEMRLSNFMLWQMAYTELYVTETLWPDFGRTEFLRALLAYQHRERRYGMTSEQLGLRGEACDGIRG